MNAVGPAQEQLHGGITRYADCLLLGGGIASASAAATLRSEGATGSVMMVSAEDVPPYHHTALSKGLLLGDDAIDPRLEAGEQVEAGEQLLAQLDQVGARRKLLMPVPESGLSAAVPAGVLARHGIELTADRMEIDL